MGAIEDKKLNDTTGKWKKNVKTLNPIYIPSKSYQTIVIKK